MNTTSAGAQAEEQAAQYLTRKGYRVVARNFRVSGGEIDIIALAKSTLVFVEVKKRASQAFGGPVAAVTPLKQKRIAQTAAQFIKINTETHYQSVRFDVICISPAGLDHIENAFFPARMTI